MNDDPLSQNVDGGGGRAARPFLLIAILGAPASGKTSLTQELVDESLRRGREVRVLDPAGNWGDLGEWPEDKDGLLSPEEIAERWLLSIKKKRPRGGMHRPALLVLEDADAYLGGGQPRGVWRSLFATYRHWRCDVIVNARRTQDLPKLVFTSASYVYAFRHHVSTNYLHEHYGDELVASIPRQPFRFACFDVEHREVTMGETRKRAMRTASDGG